MSELIKRIDVHELKNKMDNNPQLCVIDVREPEEWQEFHIPGALHIPKGQIAEHINSVVQDEKTPLYLYCRGGVRSLYAAQQLADLGYQELYSIDGGIMDWAMAHYPIIS